MMHKVKVTLATRKSHYFMADLESAKAEMTELFGNPEFINVSDTRISVKLDGCHVAKLEILEK